MIYFILKQLINYSIKAFFRQFVILGKKNIPKNSPAIFVANHPSALMDPLVVGVSLKQKIYFLAGSNWFGKGFQSYLFMEHFNMIPVHRPWLAKSTPVSNADMFKECFKSLEKGRSILLFPEASSETVSRIRELKTGAIRIQMGFEEYMDYKANVPIIPIGINYSNPHSFQSRVIVNIGEPIDFSKVPSHENKNDLYRERADLMQIEMERTIINISNDDNQDLVRRVNRMYLDTFKEEEKVTGKDDEAIFNYAQGVANVVAYFEKKDSDLFSRMSGKVHNYFEKLRSIKMTDNQLNDTNNYGFPVLRTLVLILGFPLALEGLLLFYLPFKVTEVLYRIKLKPWIEDGKVFDTAFTGSLIFAAGLFIFIIWNILLFLILGFSLPNWWMALVIIALGYPLFRIGMVYAKNFILFKKYLRSLKFRKSHAQVITELRNERKEIISSMKKMREQYMSQLSNLNPS